MWIGTLGFLARYPGYAGEGPGQIEWWRGVVETFLQSRGHDPLEVLAASRFFMVLAITLVLAVSFGAAVRLFGWGTAFAGFLLIAVDPFHIAHSRLLHLDGLSSSLVLLALLAFLNFLYRGERRLDLALSAGAAGLAWLTKSPTLFLAPFMGLLVFLTLAEKWRSLKRLERKDFRWGAATLVIWGAVGLGVFVLLWPAMWVDPLFTLYRVLRAMVGYAAQGHDSPVYFNGAIVDGDPGFHFYPVTYLWRTTPFVLLGLALATLAFVAPRVLKIARRSSTGMCCLSTLPSTCWPGQAGQPCSAGSPPGGPSQRMPRWWVWCCSCARRRPGGFLLPFLTS
jgi:hypothetical protein